MPLREPLLLPSRAGRRVYSLGGVRPTKDALIPPLQFLSHPVLLFIEFFKFLSQCHGALICVRSGLLGAGDTDKQTQQ